VTGQFWFILHPVCAGRPGASARFPPLVGRNRRDGGEASS